MSQVQIIHNPRCSKSRQTLALLQGHQIEVEIIEYLKTPLNKQQLQTIKTKLALDSFLQMMRVKEADFKTAGLSKVESSETDYLDAMVAYPKLIERPIVITESRAAIGRPPEAVLELFES